MTCQSIQTYSTRQPCLNRYEKRRTQENMKNMNVVIIYNSYLAGRRSVMTKYLLLNVTTEANCSKKDGL